MDKFVVEIWEEHIIIPTYETGAPEKNPMFFEKRVYQGSSGAVYPYPIIESVADEKKDKTYHAVFLENFYLRIMILPELGGRVQMAYDKIGQRHFIYYNEVIKPALVGLCGPWISGGIEFNWPQHHRPSTFSPIDFTLEENADGSKTVWVNEIERINGTRGMAGFTLYPGKAYLEVKGRVYNGTRLPQSFLWWANPAVAVNEHYQSIFPPDVHAVYDHGKRDVSGFPIAKAVYYKVDYAPGTDISRYKNIPVPTSYMAVGSNYDFIGGYEHDTAAGMLHVANHHIVPGKKQWTWGNGAFGRAWDENLTDSNGPYIELMTGVYTDNQPDFAWLMPFEEKQFTQYFLPYRKLSGIKAASRDIIMNLQPEAGSVRLELCATSALRAIVQLSIRGRTRFKESLLLIPEEVFGASIACADDLRDDEIKVVIADSSGEELLRYEPVDASMTMPAPALAPPAPELVADTESLYLIGLHLEQYRHATADPTSYYKEALQRSPGDIRCNNAMGRWLLRRGRIEESESCFRQAIETATRYNGNPYDGEPWFNLGVCLQLQDRLPEAYDAFYKSAWNNAWKANAFFALAEIDCTRGHFEKATDHLAQSLRYNSANSKAIVLKAVALQKLDRIPDALLVCREGLAQDPFNLALYHELFSLQKLAGDPDGAAATHANLLRIARTDSNNFLSYASDYARAGCWQEAQSFLLLCPELTATDPMICYYLGWISQQMGNLQAAREWCAAALDIKSAICFPNRLEDIAVLQCAAAINPADADAWYYLGCLWYDKKQYASAMECWQASVTRNDQRPAAWRNMGIAWYNKYHQPKKAVGALEKAFALDSSDARILMELDQLHKRTGKTPAERLAFLERFPKQVATRDDLFLEVVTLHNLLGNHERALQLLLNRRFHPWEGGEGRVAAQYRLSMVQLAHARIREGQCQEAIALLEKARIYPPNLGEGKLVGTPENDVLYFLGLAHERLHEMEIAVACYRAATIGLSEPVAAIFYNDPQPDTMFYQGWAWQKLQEFEVAESLFNSLVEWGKEHVNDRPVIDFFAVSLPDLLVFDDDLSQRHSNHCRYMIALGKLGQKKYEEAARFFDEVLLADPSHIGAHLHRKLLPAAVQN
jgi:tetratricopeptide (TPR) repeat protein